MSTADKIATNTQNFNEMLRRTSSRLRGGSVPPPDSDIVVPTATLESRRGRSRGRGRGNSTVSNRTNAETPTTPVVTLTVPGEEGNTSTNSTAVIAPTNKSPNNQDVPLTPGTSVLHSGGLLSRDNIDNVPNLRSPTRRNTVAEMGNSPPRGFHSWLKAKGLTVFNNPSTSNHALNGMSTALASSIVTPSWVAAPAQVKEKSIPKKVPQQVDLTKDNDEPKAAEKKKVEVSETGIEVDGLVALSPWFNAKMKPFKGYIPLSIFNPQWLRLDLVRQSQRVKKKKDSEDDRYTCLDVPDEWRMNFGEWISAFDLFVSYIRHYGHGDVADKFVIHRENVMAIKREWASWIMAFRYDQAIRSTVMTFKNADGKLANPAVRDENREREAQTECERLGDFQPRFQDINPYAEGQPKANIHPITGEYQLFNHQKQYQVANSPSHTPHYGKPNARSWQHANHYPPQPFYEGPSNPGYQQYNDRRGDGRNVRGRGRGGGWNGGSGGRDSERYGSGRENDRFANRRGEGGGSWRQDDRRDDRRGEANSPKYGGNNGKAK
ncbi:uncharacterized protein MELLADRAFT_93900 [Melampsora larici-populina 98AG31]|uniref:Uncharacterized protein n=1 Tax=Melampsora larici-populina (strain 98AG31 / pathotype 3-4-7) TaxID=747676 RepID=F4S5P2_MELLP|nr:uncharacterized protein MELLADRAFT_93900 [Melampsora larici-populina 98AG31]EGG00063.1 hypothetical protein MELLADRAFT_93900 [Melampsora larici-populina 98AG31]